MSNNAHIELVITAKELIETFHKVNFGVNLSRRMYLAIFCSVRLQSFLDILVDGVGIVEIELSFGLIGITTSGRLEESS